MLHPMPHRRRLHYWSMSRSVGIGTCAGRLEWRISFSEYRCPLFRNMRYTRRIRTMTGLKEKPVMSDLTIDDAKPTCRVIRSGDETITRQGHLSAPAISAQSVGAGHIHMQIVRIPPGGPATAHRHEKRECAIC